MKKYDLFINGEFKDSKYKRDIINPSNDETIATVCMASAKDAKYAIESARAAFDQGSWKDISLADRKSILLKISEGILSKAKELAELESLNSGKPIKETTFMDIPSAAATFEYFANNLEKYLSSEAQDIQSRIAKVKATFLREPRGVVVLIVPWNYPLLIASWKMAQALAAGNAVILKPSSLTPLTALELAKIVKEAGVPDGIVNVIPGPGEEVGEILCSSNLVDMISFTGSNAVGKKILEYSAKSVKKLIMELGGKSASIILKDADLEAAVNGSLCSIFLNQGQMCTATSRILIEESIYDAFVSQFVEKAKKIKIGDSLDFQSQIGPLASRFQCDRVISYVAKAKREGSKLLCGGKIPEDEALKKGFFFEPTVFEGVSPDSAIFQEEIF
ncbi:MAG: aldehyde dehydrogenase, partial [Candidatus Omnitrophica bacterium]|nr:aldehyde dehydrogenase [Candidatus Omnitrophota bacterium]